MLFSERSIWTMIHGLALGGGALLALSAALFALYLIRTRAGVAAASGDVSRSIAILTAFTALMLWLTTFVGTYVIFPPYRTTPPEGTTDLSGYPRSLVLSDSSTAWLHAFAMETKEHLPFISAMLATAVAFVAWRYRERLLEDESLRRIGAMMLAICFAIVAYVSLLGVFINKVAPLE
ncbi:MAG TPA: hypothetical protein VIQ74_06315 [Gemmatimonadaceae bacterium]